MDYSHYMYLRKEMDLERIMSKEDTRWRSHLHLIICLVMCHVSVVIYLSDCRGMTVTGGCVTINKDDSNLIGISIGGGAPMCPCLYIVQVFDNTPASKDGTLEAGDELVGVNGVNVKGKTKVEVAKMIQATKGDVMIKYNKLHADPKQGKSLDIVLKKMKHKMVENMTSSTADALGLSRLNLAIYFHSPLPTNVYLQGHFVQ